VRSKPQARTELGVLFGPSSLSCRLALLLLRLCATWAVVIVGIGLSAFGLGLGTGANLHALGVIIPKKFACATPPLSARERFRLCSMTEADPVPTPEELEAMLARWQARDITPAWGVP
jgi:hypothetical protein